eukprot:431125_1
MKIFAINEQKCHNHKPITENCSHIKRLAMALEYYALFDIKNNKAHQNEFNKFVKEVYTIFLDDCIHLMSSHGGKINEQQINEELVAKYKFADCKMIECEFTNRHRSRWQKETDITYKTDDPDLNFSIELFDTLHYYLIHLYHAGMRRKVFDAKNKIPETERKTNKFNVAKIMPTGDSNEDVETTFTDQLFSYMYKNLLSTDDMTRLKMMLTEEQYDTDCIKYDLYEDLEIYKAVCASNIAGLYGRLDGRSELMRKFIYERYRTGSLCTASFNVGLIFYYWPWYKKTKDKNYQENIDYDNINDYGGYTVYELYIENPKYKDLKDEILNSPHGQHFNMPITANEFKDNISLKAGKYLDTQRAKQMIALDGSKWYMQHLHYNVPKNAPLGLENFITVIVYCNFNEFSANFSSTFRASYPFEPLKSIKKRNQMFWHFSKILRETVQFYGYTGSGDSSIKGPFYCGMNFVMSIPQFNIRLCGPTSTSRQSEVAERFAEEGGIIMRLNNMTGDYYGAFYLRSFDCKWISDHKAEDEVFFFGGDFRIRLESVTIPSTSKSYEEPFSSLFYFDAMVNGSNMFKMKCSESIKVKRKKHESMLHSLIRNELEEKGEEKNDIDYRNKLKGLEYVVSTFRTFCLNKTKIVLNMDYLHRYFKELNHLVISVITRYNFNDNAEIMQNILRKDVIKLFRNVSEIIIYSTDRTGKYPYPFALALMMKCVDSAVNLKKISIKATHKYAENMSDRKNYWKSRSWIEMEFEKWNLYKQLDFKTWNLSLEVTSNSHGYNEDCLTCSRK